VIDTDTEGCFHSINDFYIMEEKTFFPSKEGIHRWLKAGYVKFLSSPTGVLSLFIVNPLFLLLKG